MAFANASEAKQNKWFSRRYQGSDGLMRYRAEKDARREAKARAEKARDLAARGRTPLEQVARLDALLGKGQGAVRERARLQGYIARSLGDDPVLGPGRD